MIKFMLGVIAGILLSSINPEYAQVIQDWVIVAYDWIMVNGPAFIQYLTEFEAPSNQT